MSRTRQPPSTGPPSNSQIQTTPHPSTQSISGTLRLRGEEHAAAHAHARSTDGSSEAPEPPRRGIRWSEDVVDNEGMGKKSSKVCCIYHKSRPVGESSSEESSSSSDDSDSEDDRSHPHGRGNLPHSHSHDGRGRCSGHQGKQRKPSPNAYEKMPKSSTSRRGRKSG